MAHFDPRGGLEPYVLRALDAYRRIADRIVLVSASSRLLPRAARDLVDDFIPRANVGHDFCSWKQGLATLTGLDLDEILCVNDSVYGPVFDLGPALSDPRITEGDLWGMVLSEQPTRTRGPRPFPHVQSWFFGARRRLLESRAWEDFWHGVKPLSSKSQIIDHYELGMSEQVLRAGFSIRALYNASTAGPVTLAEVWPHLALGDPRRSWRLWRKSRRTPHNPSELVWWRLLAAGVPFVKVGLFRINHYGIDDRAVIRALGRTTRYDLALIHDHLARLARAG